MGLVTFGMIAVVTYFATNSMTLSFFIGIYLYFYAFYKHFSALVKEVDNPPIEMADLDNPPTVIHQKKEIHAKRMLCKIVQFHIFAKE